MRLMPAIRHEMQETFIFGGLYRPSVELRTFSARYGEPRHSFADPSGPSLVRCVCNTEHTEHVLGAVMLTKSSVVLRRAMQ